MAKANITIKFSDESFEALERFTAAVAEVSERAGALLPAPCEGGQHVWTAEVCSLVEECAHCATTRHKSGMDEGTKGDPCLCGCRRDVEPVAPDPEPDMLAEAGPEPAPRVLICTEQEADVHREIWRRVITTYEIEDDPAVLRGADGAEMTQAAVEWLERFVEAVDPDAHPAYTGQPTEREAKAAAWDEGFDAGHRAARAVNPEWPEQPTNPYRIEREGQS